MALDHREEVRLTGEDLSIEEVVAVARGRVSVTPLSEQGETGAARRAAQSANWIREVTEELRDSQQQGTPPTAYYAINTGFGQRAGRAAFTDPEDARRLSRNLVMSHAVGVGEFFAPEIVRAAMLIRANTLAKGYSGVRPQVINTLITMLNQGIHPAVPCKGSVGASGDLAPLSHLALVMSRPPEGLDREEESGEVLVDTGLGITTISGKVAMERAEIKRLVLGAKEGLALNNGTSFSAALATLAVFDAENLVENAEIALAMSHEALLGFRDPFFPEVHQVRPHPGQGLTASRVLHLVEGSQFLSSDRFREIERHKAPPQDPYSQRCAPQVIGAVRDALRYVRRVVEIELNAATDNPLIFPELPRRYKAVSCGNFHGEPLALAMDFLGIAVTELGSIAERRVFRLIGTPRSQVEKHEDPDALPNCLVLEDPDREGLNSGLMLLQYTAAALVSDCKTLAHPDSVDSIPTSGNKEDHVSMSANAARHAREIVDNVQAVIAIELLCAAQALDLRLTRGDGERLALGDGTRRAHRRIREVVDHLAADRVLYPDIRAMVHLVQTGEMVRAVWGERRKGRLAAEIRALEAEIEALEARKQRVKGQMERLEN